MIKFRSHRSASELTAGSRRSLSKMFCCRSARCAGAFFVSNSSFRWWTSILGSAVWCGGGVRMDRSQLFYSWQHRVDGGQTMMTNHGKASGTNSIDLWPLCEPQGATSTTRIRCFDLEKCIFLCPAA